MQCRRDRRRKGAHGGISAPVRPLRAVCRVALFPEHLTYGTVGIADEVQPFERFGVTTALQVIVARGTGFLRGFPVGYHRFHARGGFGGEDFLRAVRRAFGGRGKGAVDVCGGRLQAGQVGGHGGAVGRCHVPFRIVRSTCIPCHGTVFEALLLDVVGTGHHIAPEHRRGGRDVFHVVRPYRGIEIDIGVCRAEREPLSVVSLFPMRR